MSIPQTGGGPIERPEQLVEYLSDGCKPKEDWRIGTEHEKFGFYFDDYTPVPYEGERGIKALLQGMETLLGWGASLRVQGQFSVEKQENNLMIFR